MATRYSAQALVLAANDQGEADKIFSLFSQEFGRLEVTAKAIRKMASKLRGGISVFSISGIEFVQGKNKYILTDATFSKRFSRIWQNPESLVTATEISNTAQLLLKGQERDLQIFSLLCEAFEKLSTHPLPTTHYSLVYQYFFWNFMAALGYAPQVLACAQCAKMLKAQENYFSVPDGGIVCGLCGAAKKSGLMVGTGEIKILRLILKKDWATLEKLKSPAEYLASLKKISHYYLKAKT